MRLFGGDPPEGRAPLQGQVGGGGVKKSLVQRTMFTAPPMSMILCLTIPPGRPEFGQSAYVFSGPKYLLVYRPTTRSDDPPSPPVSLGGGVLFLKLESEEAAGCPDPVPSVPIRMVRHVMPLVALLGFSASLVPLKKLRDGFVMGTLFSLSWEGLA